LSPEQPERRPERPLDGQVALITGAVRRIGRATALALSEDGAAIVVNCRSAVGEARAVAAEIEARGGRALVQVADVTDEAAVAAMAEATLAAFGRIDILVNNAAVRRQAKFTEMTLQDWREINAVILDGAFLCARACLPPMIAGGGGSIVNIGGMTAHTGVHYRAHVATAKAGLVGLTRALAVEFAADRVTVNCVVPGKIGGERSGSSGAAPPTPGAERPLVGRMGTPEEVAEMVRYLCRPAARYITGQSIHLNGGLYLG